MYAKFFTLTKSFFWGRPDLESCEVDAESATSADFWDIRLDVGFHFCWLVMFDEDDRPKSFLFQVATVFTLWLLAWNLSTFINNPETLLNKYGIYCPSTFRLSTEYRRHIAWNKCHFIYSYNSTNLHVAFSCSHSKIKCKFFWPC